MLTDFLSPSRSRSREDSEYPKIQEEETSTVARCCISIRQEVRQQRWLAGRLIKQPLLASSIIHHPCGEAFGTTVCLCVCVCLFVCVCVCVCVCVQVCECVSAAMADISRRLQAGPDSPGLAPHQTGALDGMSPGGCYSAPGSDTRRQELRTGTLLFQIPAFHWEQSGHYDGYFEVRHRGGGCLNVPRLICREVKDNYSAAIRTKSSYSASWSPC